MKRIAQLFGAALLVTAFCFSGDAAGRFDQKLLLDKQIVHVLNRLTFGPRPGDIQQVRRMGVDKWIDQQLHPGTHRGKSRPRSQTQTAGKHASPDVADHGKIFAAAIHGHPSSVGKSR